jgi:hypothetical protein
MASIEWSTRSFFSGTKSGRQYKSIEQIARRNGVATFDAGETQYSSSSTVGVDVS